MKKVKLENILKELDNNLDPYRKLIKFYELLGWDKQKELDPTKVRLNRKDLEILIRNEMQNAEKFGLSRLEVGFLWINRGPGEDSNIEEGIIVLKDGWQI
jgi:hypothetical protein